MTAFGSLLAATDFSEDARRACLRAAQLAKARGARLTLLHVVDRGALDSLQDLFDAEALPEAAALAAAQQELDRWAGELAAQTGVTALTRVSAGNVLDAIAAAAQDADLLVLGARGASPLRDLIIGSTAERVIRRSPRPTLVVRQAPGADYRHLLVPADFSTASRPSLELALRFAPDAALTLVHALDTSTEGKLWLAGVSTEKMRAHRAGARSQAMARAAELIEGAGGERQRIAVVVEADDAARLVLATAVARDADLIVIGRQGQSLLADFLLGSVTRHVVTGAACDVLIDATPGAS